MNNKIIICKTVIPILFIFLVGVTVFSCKKDKATIANSCSNLPNIVSFKNNIIPLFKAQCSTSGCHTGSNPGGHLNLDSLVAYSQLMQSGTGYIDTLNPSASVLYASLISSSQIMPPAGKLDDCTIQLVYKWIQQKAKNN